VHFYDGSLIRQKVMAASFLYSAMNEGTVFVENVVREMMVDRADQAQICATLVNETMLSYPFQNPCFFFVSARYRRSVMEWLRVEFVCW